MSAIRIIGGLRKGKKIIAPSNLNIRPTTDIAKEALFSILNNNYDFEEVNALDIFAGTGNISYEFASRGVPQILAIDNKQECINFILKTAACLKFYQLAAICSDAIVFLQKYNIPTDIIFADPPFNYENILQIPELVFKNKLLKESGCLVIEHSEKNIFEKHCGITDVRKYGSVCFSFFKNIPHIN